MLKSRTSQIVAALALIGILVAGGLAYAFLRPPEEASAPISAIPIEIPTEQGDEQYYEPDYSSGSDSESGATADNAVDNLAPAIGSVVLFAIVQAESEARFIMHEILRGQPNTIVGATDQVAGEIAIDPNNPSATKMGTILINARTFTTDSSMRDRTIRNQILLTNTYEFITFTPTSISGWPQQVLVGDTINLTIVGNLTLLDVTREVTFVMTIVAVSNTRIEGIGSTTILYADYGISIPKVPSVTGVDDDLLLEIEFVAVAVD